jgi:hypothetical protein
MEVLNATSRSSQPAIFGVAAAPTGQTKNIATEVWGVHVCACVGAFLGGWVFSCVA